MKHAETVTFGGSGLDRAAHLRADDAQIGANPAARAVVLWRGKPLITSEGGPLARLPLDHPVMADAGDVRVFLGQDDDGPVFAVNLSRWTPELPDGDELNTFLDASQQQHPATGDAIFAELRAIMTTLSPRDGELASTARAVLGWHDSHKFCSSCGTLSNAVDAGWRRLCPTCDTSHFPRTDPVVIMLIVADDEVLVGRSPGWPEGMYSLLAGFVEPGETMEAAVRREVFEEAGIRIGEVSYLASQPWAFPSSLMLGCYGTATSKDITLDPVELEDARWVSRSEMEQVARGEHPTILPARKGAIAHFLLENWLANTLD
ncbi:NAD+ diphosphatase [Octadecabacter temperatus]|uniref:NAD(+) diphosphatase n=1 Tax=Octadecabacter temperatus TaxID=1458307 RepID=A0A0K0Y913_9RHOB|nr:NAD(+) diphosphatase [Octadecabacter temperatus]AKS47357.1 NADH pyrophosphatase [Octadecabacter temperatus]SIO43584.1 NAD+ diphosphatase [Octadecabacter temperatus]